MKTFGDVWVMVLEIPPADVSDAVAPVRVRVCTRDKAASNLWQDEGLPLSATTRNSMGVPGMPG